MGRKSRKAKSFAAFEHFSGGSLNARLHNSGFAVLKKNTPWLAKYASRGVFRYEQCMQTDESCVC